MPAGTLAGVPVFPIIMFFPSSVQGAPFVRSTLCAGVAAACLFGSKASLANGVEPVEALETIVVTATRDARPVSQSLASVSVLTRDDIEQRSATTLADLLRYLPGVEISRTGGPASTTTLFIRGAETRHTLVLIDGVPVDSQATGGAPWEALLASDIERVELVRGAASAVYGGNPIAGVVQIFTKTQGTEKARVELGLGVGNLDTVKADAKVSGKYQSVSYNLSVTQQRSSGFDSSTNSVPGTPKADRDGYRAKGMNASVGWQVQAGQRLELATRSQLTRGEYDGYTPTLGDQSTNQIDSTSLSWVSNWNDLWRTNLRVGQTDVKYDNQPSGYETSTQLQVVNWEHVLNFGQHQLRVVLDGQRDELINSDLPQSATPGVGKRRNGALGLGYDGQADQWLWSASAREDHDSEFGSHWTGSGSIGFQPVKTLTVRAGWANAFRAPTLYQRFSTYGNANLRPETSQTREVGLRWGAKPMSLEVTAFESRVKDLVQYDYATDRYANTGRAKLKGLELAAMGVWGDSRLEARMNWDTPKSADTDTVLVRRARQHGSVRVETMLGGWTIGGAALVSGKRSDWDGSKLGGFTTWAVDAQTALSSELKLLIQTENLSNKKYETAAGYRSVPRTVLVALKWVPKL